MRVSIKPETGGFPRESASLIENQPEVCDPFPGVSPQSTREPLKDNSPPASPTSITLQKRPPSFARHLRVARRHLRALAWNDNAQGAVAPI